MSGLMSLDDIIKSKKKLKTNTAAMRNNRGPVKRLGAARANGTVGPRRNNPIKNGVTTNNRPVQDARFKIIQKNRRTIGDARDKLAQIAKQGDARQRLERIQKLKGVTTKPKKLETAGAQLRRTARNGQVTSTGAGATRGILSSRQPATRQRVVSSRQQVVPPRQQIVSTRRAPRHQPQQIVVQARQPIIRQAAPVYVQQPRTITYRPPQVLPAQDYMTDMLLGGYGNNALDYLTTLNEASMRRAVASQYTPPMPPPPPIFNIKPAQYEYSSSSSSRPVTLTHHHSSGSGGGGSLSRSQAARLSDHNSRPRDYKVISTRAAVSSRPEPYKSDWSLQSKNRTILPAHSSLDSKLYTTTSSGSSSSRNHRDSGVKSRLDTLPAKSSRPVANSRPKPAQTIGYRIVVSNLQPNVTKEDIKELFEDVGELLVSRLVKPGVAEVIYKTLKDATKAVDTYHNRQLDGHPMKCLLVNSEPKTSTTTTTSSGRVLSQSRTPTTYSRNIPAVYQSFFN